MISCLHIYLLTNKLILFYWWTYKVAVVKIFFKNDTTISEIIAIHCVSAYQNKPVPWADYLNFKNNVCRMSILRLTPILGLICLYFPWHFSAQRIFKMRSYYF